MAQQTPRHRPTNLIEELLANPVEPAYAEEHARRRRAGHAGSPRRGTGRVALTLTLLVIGLLVAVGYVGLRPDEVASSPRAELAARLQERQDLYQEQAAALDREQRAVEAEQQSVLRSGGDEDAARTLEAHGVAAGATEVEGDGVRIELDDAPGADPQERVVAADLQRTVNLLWAADARAVSINDHRLSSTAGIRFAGKALVVDFRALERPYVIEAVGPADLPERFDELGGPDRLAALRDELGLRTSWERANGLTLPADPTLTLHHARPVTVESP
ncbi:DUF881 domain-containing protein [Kytococcus sp. Marseille-QA3725]